MRGGRAGGTAVSSRSSTDLARLLHDPDTLSSSSSSLSVTVDRCTSAEQSDGRRPRANSGRLQVPPKDGVAGWIVGVDGRRRLPNVDGRNRLRNDDRSPPRVRVSVTGVDGPSRQMEGESSCRELNASVLFDTLVVDMRFSDELPPPPREKIDSLLGSVSTGDITAGSGDSSVSSAYNNKSIELSVAQLYRKTN